MAPGPPPSLLVACFLSGAAALVYQVLWTRQLTLLLGHTVVAVSTVLATFMAGLALGGALAAGGVERVPPARRSRAYALIEIGIAGAAILFPLLLRGGMALLIALHRPEGSPALLEGGRIALSAASLLAPTALMGMTIPLLTAIAGPPAELAGRVAGSLYAANTGGAVMGALACVFLLLPGLGIGRSTLVAVSWNLAAAAIVWRGTGMAPSATRSAAGDATAARTKLVLGVIALSGLAALADEVAWTRALVLLVGPTAFAFAFVLATVIAGIALGSAAAARGRHPALLLALVESAAAMASLAVVVAIGRVPVPVGELVRANADRMGRLMALELAGVFLLLALPSALFGAAFPLAVQVVARPSGAARATARVYAWNTWGAVAGALLAGFVALPRFGIQPTLVAAAAVQALAGALALAASGLPRAKLYPSLVFAVAAFALAAASLPAWDRDLLSGGVYKYAVYAAPGRLEEELRAGELVFYREGAEVTVSVKRLGGTLSLAVDGKIDATSGADMLTQRLLAHLPLLLHPAPREACVIGLGSGVTAGSALAHPLRRLDAVEISPDVVAAARLFVRSNRGVLDDPRLALRVADGRNHLLMDERRYDVIISEPSNPWMAGVSALFTRDFFRLARSRLAPGGLLCQWTHIYNMDPRDLRTVVAGFTDVFGDSALFLVNEGDALLVGGEPRLPRVDVEVLARRMEEPEVREDLAGVEVRTPAGLATLYALGGEALVRFAAGAPRHTDDRPRLEFSAPRFLHADTARENRTAIRKAAHGFPAPAALAAFAALGAAPPPATRLERARMLERAGSFGWAMDLYQEAMDDSRPDVAAMEGLVRAALKSGRAAEAEQVLRRLTAGPARAAAHTALGLLFLNLDRPGEALGELAAAAEADPRAVRPLLLGAEVQEGAGNIDAVEGLARQALAVAPGDGEAEGFLATAMLARGRRDEALQRSETVLARSPHAARALEVAAIARAQKGDPAGARRAFETLLQAEPDGWAHFNNFGVFEMESGDPREAARLFHQAVSLNPRNVEGYRGLREAARGLGDGALLARAQAALRRLGVQDPETP